MHTERRLKTPTIMRNGVKLPSSANRPMPSPVSHRVFSSSNEVELTISVAAPGRKRDVPERPNWMLERLVIQALNAGVTAEELCGSETSWGPDYIGSDQKFCDMTDKVVSSLCELEDVDGCVEFDDTDLSLKKRSSVARRAVKTQHKFYKTVTKAPKGRTSKGGKKA
jgi:hypothetical protein